MKYKIGDIVKYNSQRANKLGIPYVIIKVFDNGWYDIESVNKTEKFIIEEQYSIPEDELEPYTKDILINIMSEAFKNCCKDPIITGNDAIKARRKNLTGLISIINNNHYGFTYNIDEVILASKCLTEVLILEKTLTE